MQKIARFFQNIVNSVLSAEFYYKVLNTPLSFSMKYFMLLILMVSLVYTAFFEFKLIPEFSKFINTGITKVESLYPSDLILTMENGVLTTNAKEPYFVTMESVIPDIKTQNQEASSPANILVIDTKTPFDEQQYKNYSTIVWLTKTSMVYPDSGNSAGGIRLMPFSEFKEKVVLDKKTVDSGIIAVKPMLVNLTNIFALLFFPMICLMLLLYKLSCLLWTALLVFILAKIAKYNFSYSKSYQLSLHASTLPLFIQMVSTLAGVNIFIPFWYTLLTLIILFFIIRKPYLKA